MCCMFSCHRIGELNYRGSGLPVDDRKTFHKADVATELSRIHAKYPRMDATSATHLYDLVVVDPPPSFSSHSKMKFVAKHSYSTLLASCLRVTRPGSGSLVLAGLNAITVTDQQLEAMVTEASQISGVATTVLEKVVAGADFEPGCPHRPTARFFLLECD